MSLIYRESKNGSTAPNTIIKTQKNARIEKSKIIFFSYQYLSNTTRVLEKM